MARKKQPAYTETPGPTGLSLKRLKEIFDTEFGPPFLDGQVGATWHGEGRSKVLNIKIGRRDIDLDEKGEVVGSGTYLRMASDL